MISRHDVLFGARHRYKFYGPKADAIIARAEAEAEREREQAMQAALLDIGGTGDGGDAMLAVTTGQVNVTAGSPVGHRRMLSNSSSGSHPSGSRQASTASLTTPSDGPMSSLNTKAGTPFDFNRPSQRGNTTSRGGHTPMARALMDRSTPTGRALGKVATITAFQGSRSTANTPASRALTLGSAAMHMGGYHDEPSAEEDNNAARLTSLRTPVTVTLASHTVRRQCVCVLVLVNARHSIV